MNENRPQAKENPLMVLAGLVAILVLASGCGSERDVYQAGGTTPVPVMSPVPVESPSPTPEEPILSAKDRRYLRQVRRGATVSSDMSDEAAIRAGRKLCATIRRADRKTGSVNVELDFSFTKFEVNGFSIPVDLYVPAIKAYCPSFSSLFQELPAP